MDILKKIMTGKSEYKKLKWEMEMEIMNNNKKEFNFNGNKK
jgi:hypothetical protein